ncbi:GGDEF domain-containing phosphodiesterase [Euzebya rosea]|uniref:GGDEF domain-containing phosphodiesterase n=1 Tax=Euzebya rosea TaxID=2052804 RepID=UPI001300A49E|nr:GGDEF domain-containing phosphodiesterase [Euzebya rosea]
MGEHVVCLVTDATPDAATARALQMVHRLEERILSRDVGLVPGVLLRTGMASAPVDGDSPGELVRVAAAAMYGATGGHDAPVRRPHVEPGVRRRPEIIRLPDPMDTLEVAYQPKVAFSDGRLVGAEALVRWPPSGGTRVPAQTIVEMARSAGRLIELTDVVMRQAAGHCARMRDAGFTVPISINLTGDDVADPRLPQRLDTVLGEHDLPRDSLVLEVTETALLTREVEALGVIPQLAELGTRVSVDDFGTGYSSLSHLRRFPIHEIKIDMSFVDRMVLEPLDAVIVRSIIEMGHGLGMDVVAEGVETADTWAVLAELGTDIAQGHHVMRAVDPATFLAWARFRRQRATPAATAEQPRG